MLINSPFIGNKTSGVLKSRIHAEAEPLHDSLLQLLRILPSRREGKMRSNCKKSSRSPQATILKGQHARLNATFEKPWTKHDSHFIISHTVILLRRDSQRPHASNAGACSRR